MHNIKIMLPKLEDFVINEHLIITRRPLKGLEDYAWLKSIPRVIYDEKELFSATGGQNYKIEFI